MITKDKIAELQGNGFCLLRAHFPKPLIDACREAFWPVLLDYLKSHGEQPNRGPRRHFLSMPFKPPCFTPEFFFDPGVLRIVHGVMDDRVVADQWGCDVPLRGSRNQEAHVDYQRPLFAEAPLEIGDVLVRHPWALHRGTPNTTDTPRALVTIRYVRRWYADNSREINPIPHVVWQSLTLEQKGVMRFPIGD